MPDESQYMMSVDEGGRKERKMPVNYPSNSKTSRAKPEEKPKVEKVVEGEVVQRRRGAGSKFVRSFLSDDAPTVGSYVLLEVFLPAAKNMLVEAGQQALERIFFGDRPRRSGDSRGGYINYQRASQDRQGGQRVMSHEARAQHRFEEWELPNRSSAMNVLEQMQAHIDEYQVVTVADLYDMLGITSDFTDNKWGWTNISKAAIRQIRGGGYYLDLPPTKSLT